LAVSAALPFRTAAETVSLSLKEENEKMKNNLISRRFAV